MAKIAAKAKPKKPKRIEIEIKVRSSGKIELKRTAAGPLSWQETTGRLVYIDGVKLTYQALKRMGTGTHFIRAKHR